MIRRRLPLFARKKLEFTIVENDVPGDHLIKWKVLNRGDEARRRDEARGQIVPDTGNHRKTENTKSRGDHVVECYAIKNGVVVAKDRIHVPISTNE